MVLVLVVSARDPNESSNFQAPLLTVDGSEIRPTSGYGKYTPSFAGFHVSQTGRIVGCFLRQTSQNLRTWEMFCFKKENSGEKTGTLRIPGMSLCVKITCFEAPGVSLGGSGVSVGGVKIVRARV